MSSCRAKAGLQEGQVQQNPRLVLPPSQHSWDAFRGPAVYIISIEPRGMAPKRRLPAGFSSSTAASRRHPAVRMQMPPVNLPDDCFNSPCALPRPGIPLCSCGTRSSDQSMETRVSPQSRSRAGPQARRPFAGTLPSPLPNG